VGMGGGSASKWEERLKEEHRRERREAKEMMRSRQDDQAKLSTSKMWAPVSGRGAEEFDRLRGGYNLGEAELHPESANVVDVPLVTDMILPNMDLDPPRSFSRAEIRKMLHPDIDITDVEPLVPLRVMRTGSRAGKRHQYNRWKYTQNPNVGAGGEYGGAGYTSSRPQSTPPGVGGLGRPGTRAKTAPAGGVPGDMGEIFRFPGMGDGFGKPVKNYVHQTAGPFPLLHNFRPVTKENWKSAGDFVPAGNFGGWGMGFPVAKDGPPNAAVKAYQNKRFLP